MGFVDLVGNLVPEILGEIVGNIAGVGIEKIKDCLNKQDAYNQYVEKGDDYKNKIIAFFDDLNKEINKRRAEEGKKVKKARNGEKRAEILLSEFCLYCGITADGIRKELAEYNAYNKLEDKELKDAIVSVLLEMRKSYCEGSLSKDNKALFALLCSVIKAEKEDLSNDIEDLSDDIVEKVVERLAGRVSLVEGGNTVANGYNVVVKTLELTKLECPHCKSGILEVMRSSTDGKFKCPKCGTEYAVGDFSDEYKKKISASLETANEYLEVICTKIDSLIESVESLNNSILTEDQIKNIVEVYFKKMADYSEERDKNLREFLDKQNKSIIAELSKQIPALTVEAIRVQKLENVYESLSCELNKRYPDCSYIKRIAIEATTDPLANLCYEASQVKFDKTVVINILNNLPLRLKKKYGELLLNFIIQSTLLPSDDDVCGAIYNFADSITYVNRNNEYYKDLLRKRLRWGFYRNEFSNDLFMACSSKDEEQVEKIAQYLDEHSNIKYFYYRHHLIYDKESYKSRLKEALKKTKCFLFVYSCNSVNVNCEAIEELETIRDERDFDYYKNGLRLGQVGKYSEKFTVNNWVPRICYVINGKEPANSVAKGTVKEFFGSLPRINNNLEELVKIYDEYIRKGKWEDVEYWKDLGFSAISYVKNPDGKESNVYRDMPTDNGKGIVEPTQKVITAADFNGKKLCRGCNTFNDAEDNYCTQCGGTKFYKDFDEYNTKYCYDCLNPNVRSAIFCSKCRCQKFISEEERDKESAKRAAEEERKRKEEERQKQEQINSYIRQGDAAFKQEDYKKAIDLYSEAVKLGSEEAKSKKAKAEQIVEEERKRKEQINSYIRQGDAAFKQEDYKKAIDLYSEAVKLGSEEAKSKKAKAEQAAEEERKRKEEERKAQIAKDFEIKDGVLVKYKGKGGDVIIPDGVTSIGGYAFYWCKSLKSITIPSGVTSVGGYAFNACMSLESITIPSSVTSIGEHAFNRCSSLKNITIPSGVTSIGGYAFNACMSLESITIPSSVTSIGERVFDVCTSLKSINVDKRNTAYKSIDGNLYSHDGTTLIQYVIGKPSIVFNIPSGVTSIGKEAFYFCKSLKSITIPSSVTYVGFGAFRWCTSLKSIIVNENNKNYKSIDGNLYSYDGKTLMQYAIGKTDTTFIIPVGVTTIEEQAFFDCKSLESITIPRGVTFIGEDAFSCCESLKSITIPSSVTLIDKNAFSYCISLESIIIPSSVTSIGENAFDGCKSLKKIYFEAKKMPDGWDKSWINNCEAQVVWGYKDENYAENLQDFEIKDGVLVKYKGKGGDVIIPDGVTSIGIGAFEECDFIESITIPSRVTAIEAGAFSDCTSLKSINVYKRSAAYKSIDGNLYSRDGKTLVQYAIGKPSIVFNIPSGVTSVGEHAFNGCKSLESITISGSVTTIGKSAFEECVSLKNIDIPNSVISIDNDAFRGCTSLERIIIPSSVSSIAYNAFEVCESLKRIIVDQSNKNYKSKDGNLYSRGGKTLVQYAIGKTDTTFIIPVEVTVIDSYAFSGCTSLKSITIPSGVTFIGVYAFGGCTSLESITIPSSVTYIGFGAFLGGSSLTKINCEVEEKPDGWNDDWLCGCGALVVWKYKSENVEKQQGIDKPEPKTEKTRNTHPAKGFEIKDGVLVKYNGKGGNIIIPNGVTSIGAQSFIGCKSLVSITIPRSITSIGAWGFAGCTALKGIIIPSSVTSMGVNAFFNCLSLTKIYCEAEMMPDHWHKDWLGDCKAQVVWGYKGDIYPKSQQNKEPKTEKMRNTHPAKDCEVKNGVLVKYKGKGGDVIIPDGVTSIGIGAFEECGDFIESITIPSSVTAITAWDVSDCKSLKSIIVNESNKNYKSIDGNLYSRDGKILIRYAIGKTDATFIIPNGVTSIGKDAFYFCESLASITIPSGVSFIGNGTFDFCTSLKSIIVNESNRNYKSIDGNLYSYDGKTLIQYAIGKTDATFIIPNEVTSIKDYAFFGCKSLESITIPSSVTSIGERVFNVCTSLKSINVDKRNTAYKSIDGNLYSRDGKILIRYAIGKTDTVFIIPSGVTSIGKDAFYFCESLASIKIPSSVASIGESAFDWCKSLKRITIPSGITSIGESAFCDCESLESITIPSSVTSIGGNVFNGGSSLTKIYCESEKMPDGWDKNWLGGCKAKVVWGYKKHWWSRK